MSNMELIFAFQGKTNIFSQRIICAVPNNVFVFDYIPNVSTCKRMQGFMFSMYHLQPGMAPRVCEQLHTLTRMRGMFPLSWVCLMHTISSGLVWSGLSRYCYSM